MVLKITIRMKKTLYNYIKTFFGFFSTFGQFSKPYLDKLITYIHNKLGTPTIENIKLKLFKLIKVVRSNQLNPATVLLDCPP